MATPILNKPPVAFRSLTLLTVKSASMIKCCNGFLLPRLLKNEKIMITFTRSHVETLWRMESWCCGEKVDCCFSTCLALWRCCLWCSCRCRGNNWRYLERSPRSTMDGSRSILAGINNDGAFLAPCREDYWNCRAQIGNVSQVKFIGTAAVHFTYSNTAVWGSCLKVH